MFHLKSFTDLGGMGDWTDCFSGEQYAAWKTFRESEESRFAALVLPRILARLPYGEGAGETEGFTFTEMGSSSDKCYLWGNAVWVYAARVTAALNRSGWFARTHGADSGKIESLPVHWKRESVEKVIGKRLGNNLSSLGFLPIVRLPERPSLASSVRVVPKAQLPARTRGPRR